MMKHLFFLTCLFIAVYTDISPEIMKAFRSEVRKLGEECKKEMGATDDDVKPMINHEPPTTDKGKCFLACMNKKFGVQAKSGKFARQHIAKLLENLKALDEGFYGQVKPIADVCLSEVQDGDDECANADNMFRCIKREEIAHNFPKIDYVR